MGALAMTLADAVSLRIGDLAGDNWTDTDIYAFLSEGQRYLAQHLCDSALWSLSKVETVTLVAGTAEYDLPSDFLRDRAVKYKTVWAKRWPLSKEDSLRRNQFTSPSEANPYYLIWGGQVRFPRLTVTQAGSENFSLWYIRVPPAMSEAELEEPVLPTALYNLLEDFAVMRCLEARGDAGPAALRHSHLVEEIMTVNARYRGKPAFDNLTRDPKPEVLLQSLTQGETNA